MKRGEIMKLNGKGFQLEKSMNLYDFFIEKEIKMDRVVIELNGHIIPKEKFNTTMIKNHDSLEVISFVGGG